MKPGIDESYPETLPPDEVPLYLSQLKAAAYRDDIAADEMILTADTVVISRLESFWESPKMLLKHATCYI